MKDRTIAVIVYISVPLLFCFFILLSALVQATKIYCELNNMDENSKRLMNLQLQEKQIPYTQLAGGAIIHAYGFSYALSGYQKMELTKYGNSYALDGKRLILMPVTAADTRNSLASSLWEEISKDKRSVMMLERMTGKPLANQYDLTVVQYSIGLEDLSLYDSSKNAALTKLLFSKTVSFQSIYRFDNGKIKGFLKVFGSVQQVDFYDCDNPEKFGYLSFIGQDFTQREIEAVVGTITFDP